MHNRRGIFIAVEGPNRSGKTQLTQELKRKLARIYDQPELLRLPGGTEYGQHMRSYLVEKPDRQQLHWKTETAAQGSVTWEAYDKVVAPALNAGRPVVCDRYLLSAFVYQCLMPGLNVHDYLEVALPLMPPEPDLYVLLHADRQVLEARKAQSEAPDFYETLKLDEVSAYAVTPSFTRAPILHLCSNEMSTAELAEQVLNHAILQTYVHAASL